MIHHRSFHSQSRSDLLNRQLGSSATLLPPAIWPPENLTSAEEIEFSLLKQASSLSPKYLYDELGSKLFEAICELPEYYPTRTEAWIFENDLAAIAKSIGTGTTLIDLGAGNCAKAKKLFPTLRPRHYIPIDVSQDFLQKAAGQLQASFTDIEICPLAMDFSASLTLPNWVPSERRLFFYPGSSIGNFDPAQALAFLQQICAACSEEGSLLIGVDLRKEISVLNRAYDDDLGVTAAFNLNALRNVNKILGSDFDLRQWKHVAFFNSDESRIEMHLEARQDLTVHWPRGRRVFRQNETIHTENSYKYTAEGFHELLFKAGFHEVHSWSDPLNWFMVCHAKVLRAH